MGEDPAFAISATRRDIKRRDEAYGRLILRGDLGDGADEVELELRLVVRIEVGDDGLFIPAGDRGSEEKVLGLRDGDLLNFIERSGVFLIGVRFGVYEVDTDIPVLRESGKLFEEVVDARDVALQVCWSGAEVTGDVVVDYDRLAELAENGLGAIGQREAIILGEVYVLMAQVRHAEELGDKKDESRKNRGAKSSADRPAFWDEAQRHQCEEKQPPSQRSK